MPALVTRAGILTLVKRLHTASANIEANFNAQIRIFAGNLYVRQGPVCCWNSVVFNGRYKVTGFNTRPNHTAKLGIGNQINILVCVAIAGNYYVPAAPML